MQNVEFKVAIENGRLAIREEFKQLEHKLVRVVLLSFCAVRPETGSNP